MARAGKTCATPGCGKIRAAQGSWCTTCVAAYEQARGSRQQRGYGREHEVRRRQLLDALRVRQARGLVTLCPRCGLPMTTSQALHAGHSVSLLADPTAKADQLEHASCNIAAGAN